MSKKNVPKTDYAEKLLNPRGSHESAEVNNAVGSFKKQLAGLFLDNAFSIEETFSFLTSALAFVDASARSQLGAGKMLPLPVVANMVISAAQRDYSVRMDTIGYALCPIP